MITQSELKKLLHYDPESGNFIWIVRPCHRMQAGDCTGGTSKFTTGNTYTQISVKGRAYFAHRLAWLYMTGQFPKNQIDHINGIGYDNRWKNLRDVTNQENARNMKMKFNNTSGFTGVVWRKDRSKWAAKIRVDGILIHLGAYKTRDEAVKARKAANKRYGFHENHGRATPTQQSRLEYN